MPSNAPGKKTQLTRVRYEKKERVAYITLNRPECLNAMDSLMHEELKYIWDDFESDEDLACGVLSGTGGRAFCVGQDLRELDEIYARGEPKPSGIGSRGKSGWPRLTERWGLTKPLIAKVQGYAFGGGLELALACDIIVATSDSSFALPEVKLGLIAGAGGVFRLLRQMPHHVAMGYLLTGKSFSAERALVYGLVNDVVPTSQIDSCIDLWLSDILNASSQAQRAIKDIAIQSENLKLEKAFSHHYFWEEERKKKSNSKERVRAFVEKRAH